MQPEQQRRQGIWSSRADVAPPPGLQPLASYRLANAFRAFIMDEPRVKSLRARYEAFTGPVRGEGTYRWIPLSLRAQRSNLSHAGMRK